MSLALNLLVYNSYKAPFNEVVGLSEFTHVALRTLPGT